MEWDCLMMSLLAFLPALFGLTLLLIPKGRDEWMRWWALTGTVAALVVGLCVAVDYYDLLDRYPDENGRPLHGEDSLLERRADRADAREFAAAVPEPRLNDDYVARRKWIPAFNIRYALAVDGFSLPLILLTNVVMVFSVLAGWKVQSQVRGFLCLMLILETGVIGAFLSLDLFLFYVFYELMLIPMYFLIGIWGGANRKLAAFKFVVYTLAGSVMVLVAIIGLSLTDVTGLTGGEPIDREAAALRREDPSLTDAQARENVRLHTFDIVTLQKAGRDASGHLGSATADGRTDQAFYTPAFQYTMFLLMFVGFAIKIPLVPLHSWLPDAHVEAPTAVSMVLAGILLKLGGYGIIRFAYGMFPWAAEQLTWYVALAGAVAIVYGAFLALGQTDFKRLLAYSSISHMGYVVLGVACWSAAGDAQYWAWGMNGAMFQMVAHGVTSAGLFFAVGVIYERAGHRDLTKLGGLLEPMPLFSGLSLVMIFAAMGLPGLCGFVGEFFVMMSAWHYSWPLAVAAIVTTVITAGYLLWAWQRAYTGVNAAAAGFADLELREIVVMLGFVGLAVALGVLPSPVLLSWMESSVTGFAESLAAAGGS